jgi:hypothetical protein
MMLSQRRIIAVTATKSKLRNATLFGFPNSRPTLQRFIVSRTTPGMDLVIGFEKNSYRKIGSLSKDRYGAGQTLLENR